MRADIPNESAFIGVHRRFLGLFYEGATGKGVTRGKRLISEMQQDFTEVCPERLKLEPPLTAWQKGKRADESGRLCQRRQDGSNPLA